MYHKPESLLLRNAGRNKLDWFYKRKKFPYSNEVHNNKATLFKCLSPSVKIMLSMLPNLNVSLCLIAAYPLPYFVIQS